MSVRFEVDSYIVGLSRVVEVFDSSWYTSYGYTLFTISRVSPGRGLGEERGRAYEDLSEIFS